MLSSRRFLVGAILALAGVQCLILLAVGVVSWLLRDLLVTNDQQLAENTRRALAVIVWFAVNAVGLIAYAARGKGWGRRPMVGIQAANLAITLWFGFQQVSQYCGGGGLEWFVQSGLAALTLALIYVLWRRVDRPTRTDTSRAAVGPRRVAWPSVALVLIAIGLGLIGLGWNFSIQGIETHPGIVKSVQVEGLTTKMLHATLDSSSRDFIFSDIFFEPLPDLRVGDRVVILTSETCGYGSAVAAQSQRGTWIDSIYDFGIRPFTPETWGIHELIRWLAFSLGVLATLAGLASFFRWIG